MWSSLTRTFSEAVDRIMTAAGASTPGALAFLVALVAALVIGAALRVVVRRVLRRVQFDNRVDAWGFAGLADWSPARSPTLLVSRVVFWVIVLAGLAVGASALDGGLASSLVASVGAYVPKVIAALIVLAAGSFIARFVARSVLITAVNMQIQSAQLLSLGVKWLVLVFTGALVLDYLGIGRELVRISFSILIGGIVLALALAVGLGSKDVVSRSWERRETGKEQEPAGQPFRHL